MTLDYFVYRVSDGAILRRLSCPAGIDRKANVADGEAAIIATVAGMPDATHFVHPNTKQLAEKDRP